MAYSGDFGASAAASGVSSIGMGIRAKEEEERAAKAYAREKEMLGRASQRYESRMADYAKAAADPFYGAKEQYAGDIEMAEAGPSEWANISTDPRFGETQMESLRALRERGETGLTASERLQREELAKQAEQRYGQQLQAQELRAQRMGTVGGGREYAQQLAAGQQLAGQLSGAGERTAATAEERAFRAQQAAGQLATGLRGQEFGEKAQRAGALDRWQQFNRQMEFSRQQQNLARRQGMLSRRAGMAQQAGLESRRSRLAGMRASAGAGMESARTMADVEARRGRMASQRGAAAGQAAAGSASQAGQNLSRAW